MDQYNFLLKFLGLQMHANAIETNFLYLITIIFTPYHPQAVNIIMKWLIFRVMLGCGIGKYYSQDPSWKNLRAMDWHYWTMPLPNPLSPYFHRLPKSIHTLEVIATLIIEDPLLLFCFYPF